jgi:hypothetical protein
MIGECMQQGSMVELHFETNFDAIDRGDELPAIDQFWL